MSKLVLNVKYLLLLSLLNSAKFYNLGHIQDIIRVTLTQKKSFLVICISTLRSDFHVDCKKSKQTFNAKFVIRHPVKMT